MKRLKLTGTKPRRIDPTEVFHEVRSETPDWEVDLPLNRWARYTRWDAGLKAACAVFVRVPRGRNRRTHRSYLMWLLTCISPKLPFTRHDREVCLRQLGSGR